MQPIQLKISNITHLADARYFASYGAEILGFCFDPKNENYVDPHFFQEMVSWLNLPVLAGEFDKMKPAIVLDAFESLKLNYAEIHFSTLVQHSEAFHAIPLLVKISLNEWLAKNEDLEKLAALLQMKDMCCFDFENVLLKDLSPNEFAQVQLFFRQFRSFSIYPFDSKNIQEHLDKMQPLGIGLSGTKETEPGLALFEEVDAIMRVIGR